MALRPLSYTEATVANWVLIAVLIGAGIFYDDPVLWYKCFAKCFVYLLAFCFGTQLLFQVLVKPFGTLIQTSPSAQKENVAKEIYDTVLSFGLVNAAMMAWVVAQMEQGRPTAFRDDLADCVPYGSVVLYLIKAVFGLVVADAFNYWKHRAFHSKWLWAFHKVHHSHHNPSALGGYATSPMYGFVTFFPVYLFCFPILGLYLPLHWPILMFYLLLNHYLHCGYIVPAVEAVLGPTYIMTSAWHNVHHEKGRQGFNYRDQTFGEMFTVWDYYCETYPKEHGTHPASARPVTNGKKD